MHKRKEAEVLHGKKISHSAEDIWGWGTPAGRLRAARRAGFYIGTGRIGAGSRVLEIGCGTGLFTAEILKTGASVTAIDISPDLLDKARKNAGPGNVTFKVCDAENTGLESGGFDCVYGSSVLHHLDLDAALAEFSRLLKKGGRMLFTEPNMANPQILLQKNVPFIKKIMGDTPGETAFFRWLLAKKILESGFISADVVPFDFLHPWTPESLIPLVSGAGLFFERVPVLREIAGSLMITAQK